MMENQLTTKEKRYLSENFRLVDQSRGEVIPLVNFTDHCFLRGFLNRYMEILETKNLCVAASQFVKRLGYLMTVPVLYTMTVWDKKLDISLANSSLAFNTKDLPKLYLKNLSTEKFQSNNREMLLRQLLSEMFGSISNIICNVSEVSSISKSILWENVAIYIYWLYENRLETEGLPKQVHDDLHYMVYEIPGTFFNQTENPLKIFLGNKDKTRFRQTCCLYYMLNANRDCCKTCPKNSNTLSNLNLKNNPTLF